MWVTWTVYSDFFHLGTVVSYVGVMVPNCVSEPIPSPHSRGLRYATPLKGPHLAERTCSKSCEVLGFCLFQAKPFGYRMLYIYTWKPHFVPHFGGVDPLVHEGLHFSPLSGILQVGRRWMGCLFGHTGWGPSSLANLVNITTVYCSKVVYDTEIILFRWCYKPTNITQGTIL